MLLRPLYVLEMWIWHGAWLVKDSVICPYLISKRDKILYYMSDEMLADHCRIVSCRCANSHYAT
eukprot:12889572-Heterocapsa_arctica.AAC.1